MKITRRFRIENGTALFDRSRSKHISSGRMPEEILML